MFIFWFKLRILKCFGREIVFFTVVVGECGGESTVQEEKNLQD